MSAKQSPSVKVKPAHRQVIPFQPVSTAQFPEFWLPSQQAPGFTKLNRPLLKPIASSFEA